MNGPFRWGGDVGSPVNDATDDPTKGKSAMSRGRYARPVKLGVASDPFHVTRNVNASVSAAR